MYIEVFLLHAQLLKALAHPKRLEIIQLLREQELNVSDIQSMLDLPQANLSQHLTILRDARVVTTRKAGKQIFYRIAHQNFIKASDNIREILIEQYQNQPQADTLTHQMTELVPLVHDPVCHMRLSPKTASYGYVYQQQHYYFCASGCLEKFRLDPQKYLPKNK